jgi:hypothetical protein
MMVRPLRSERMVARTHIQDITFAWQSRRHRVRLTITISSPAISPRTEAQNPKSDLINEGDDDDDGGGAEDRDGVDALGMNIDENKGEGEAARSCRSFVSTPPPYPYPPHITMAASVRTTPRARTPTMTITSARWRRPRERVQERRRCEQAVVAPAGARRCANGWCT